MYSAIELAYYLVYHANKTEQEHKLKGFKIDPLLFFVQGYSLAILDMPVFKDNIIKNSYVALIKEVRDEFRKYGCLSVPDTHKIRYATCCDKNNSRYYHLKTTNIASYVYDRLDDDTRTLIEAVFKHYGCLPIPAINELIVNMDCYKYSKEIIDIELMKMDFKAKIKKAGKENKLCIVPRK